MVSMNPTSSPHFPPLVILGLRVAYYSAAKRIIIKLAFSRSFFGTFLSIQVFFFHRDQEPRHDNHKNFSRAGFFVDSCQSFYDFLIEFYLHGFFILQKPGNENQSNLNPLITICITIRNTIDIVRFLSSGQKIYQKFSKSLICGIRKSWKKLG